MLSHRPVRSRASLSDEAVPSCVGRSLTRRAAPLVLPVAATAAALLAPSCVRDGYPLSTGARVTMTTTVGNNTLYAADVLGPDGKPAYARQTPSEMEITLHMSEEQEAAFGGFVDVVVEPPDLLSLGSADDGEVPTCQQIEGFFRCTANAEGMARFIARSDADKAGVATVFATWASDKEAHVEVKIAPAGIPEGSVVAINNIHEQDTIRATGEAISCYEQGVPEDLDVEWREGFVRSSTEPLTVQVTPPLESPGAVENAPLYVSTNDATAALSLDVGCGAASRVNELRLQLDAFGKSGPFFACYSDLGGDATFTWRSGSPIKDKLVTVDVKPEPRLLRIENLLTEVELENTTGTQTPRDVFIVSAFGVHEQPLPLTVRLDLNDHVLRLNNQLVTIDASTGDQIGSTISVTPVEPGSAQLGATPFAYPQPTCKSKQVTVIPPE